MRYWWVAALVVLATGGGLFWAHARAVQAGAPAAIYQTAAVRRGNITSSMTATGTVQAWNESVVRVGVGVGGTLQPFDWNVSQAVQQGQVLFTLVNPQQDQQTSSDEASLRQDELQLQAMQAGAADTSPQQAALANAELQVQQAQYAYGLAEANLQSGQVVAAPVSGTVAATLVAQGQDIPAGGAVVSLVQTADLVAAIDVPQDQLAGIASGEPALVFANGMNHPGQVATVGPSPAVTYKGIPSYPVTITLQNPGGWLPGMPITASVETDQQPPAWATDLAGTLAPTAAVDAVTQAAGTVSSVSVQVGQAVQAGQPLARIATPTLQNAVTAAQQNLTQAQGALAALRANQAASAVAVPYSLQQLELKVQQAQATVAHDLQLEAGLVVRSPVSGVISGVQAVAGEPVGAGTPLVTIGDYSKLLVSFPLDQLYINQVKVGQPATVTATAAPGKTFAGSLYLVAPEGNDVNGVATFQAEVEIPGPTPALRPGMAVDVNIAMGTAKDVLTVPLQALHAAKGNKSFVVVVGTGVNGAPATTDVPVTVGQQNTLDAQVTGALHSGQQVLTSSLSTLATTGGLNVRGRVLQHKAQVTHRAPANARK